MTIILNELKLPSKSKYCVTNIDATPQNQLITTAMTSQRLIRQDNAPFSKAPIAICGIGLRLPGGIRNGDDFWDVLINGKDTQGPIPRSRFNIDGFDDSLGGQGTIKTRRGYFLDDDLSASLDTSFFSLSKNELERCDPQQRLLLEVVRESLEDAGEVNYRGKSIGCYVGTFGQDWYEMSAKETQHVGSHTVTGYGDMMLANRISYEYDLSGPRYVHGIEIVEIFEYSLGKAAI